MHRDVRDGVEVIVCTVGKTVLLYDARSVADLHAMLTAQGDWVELGSADEQKPAKEGTVEAWGLSLIHIFGTPIGHGRLKVVDDQREVELLRRRPALAVVGGVNPQLARPRLEDQPAAAGVDMRPFEDVPEEGSRGLGVVGIDQCMHRVEQKPI